MGRNPYNQPIDFVQVSTAPSVTLLGDAAQRVSRHRLPRNFL